MEDLVFTPLHVRCWKCSTPIQVSFESLDDNEEVTCPECGFVFAPDMNVDKLLKLIKAAEKNDWEKTNKE